MKKLSGYIRSAFYNIRRNKIYALFCIAGTALTFVFVVLVFQMVYVCTNNYPPMTHADRTIRLQGFKDMKGQGTGKIGEEELTLLLDNLKNYEAASLVKIDINSILSNDRLHLSSIGFVDGAFWKINQFEFIAGKPFTKEDCENKKKVAVISEGISVSYFNTKNSIGEKISFQENEYEITGIVKEFSHFSSPSEMCRIWVPHTFNRLASSGYFIDILFPAAMQVNVAKENLSKAVSYHFEKKGIEVDYNSKNIRTLQEERMEDLGGDTLKYGSGIIILLLLFIPAVNIVSLSVANTNDRAEEIAIRKAFGAGRLSSFLPVVMENLLLVTTGTVIGVLLAKPVFNLIQQNLIGASFDNLSFITSINFEVIFAGVIPAMLVFSLLSGGLPAYIISRSAIAEVLKGGSR